MQRIARIIILALAAPSVAHAQLPTGYFVWTKGELNDKATRAIWRLTLPDKTDPLRLTQVDAPPLEYDRVEPKISPDGQWVAYAKAILPEGTDYHSFNLWSLYVVSIHGAFDGREENKVADHGYWPSWGADGKLYYSQTDDSHTHIMRAVLDEYGRVEQTDRVVSTRSAFPQATQLNECFMSPDGSWFAARRRVGGTGDVGAFTLSPRADYLIARAGSKGCMPVVAPSGTWAVIAGAEYGIRWGDAPLVSNRQTDQMLIPAHAGGFAYHPGISSDESWVMAAHSTEQEHNSGPYDVYIYALNGRVASGEQALVTGGFNGWPDLWVGEPSSPPPPRPVIDYFRPSSWTIVSGEQVELTWEAKFCTDIALDSTPVCADATGCMDPLILCAPGNQTVAPTATTTYTLTAEHCENAGSIATMPATVTVNSSLEAVAIDAFTVEPHQIRQGESAVLTWAATNPTTLDVSGTTMGGNDVVIGPVSPSSSLSVEPLQSTTYVLTAQGHQGPKTAEVTLTVLALEEIRPELLPDRGGCRCEAAGSSAGLALLLVALGLGYARRRA